MLSMLACLVLLPAALGIAFAFYMNWRFCPLCDEPGKTAWSLSDDRKYRECQRCGCAWNL